MMAPREIPVWHDPMTEKLNRLSRQCTTGFGDEPGMTMHPEAERILRASPVDGIVIETFRIVAGWVERVQDKYVQLRPDPLFVPGAEAKKTVDRLAEEWHRKWDAKWRQMEREILETIETLMTEFDRKRAA